MNRLQALALTSSNSLIRTRAKVLIVQVQKNEAKTHENETKMEEDRKRDEDWDNMMEILKSRRSNYEILLGIEEALGIKSSDSSDSSD